MSESSQESPQKDGAPTPSEAQTLLGQLEELKAQTEDQLRSLKSALKDVSEAQPLVDKIREFRTQAEEQLKAAQVSHTKADTEALLAFNAKQACEEHSTAIAGLKGTVEAEANSILTNKQKCDDLLAAVVATKATITADEGTITDRRKEVDKAAAAIVKASETGAARLAEVETSKISAEAALKETTDSQKTAAGAQKAAMDAEKAAAEARAAAEAAKEQADVFATESGALTKTIAENQNLTKQLVDQTQALLRDSQGTEASLKLLFDHVQKTDKIATDHEARVGTLSAELDALIQRVEGLLPGATSAGLASSFNKQKSRFVAPQKLWLGTFIVTIIVLVVIAIPSFLAAVGWFGGSVDATWNDTWRSLVLRLPIVLPLIWIGIYAARNYMMSLRMEEDYAYKEAISTAFEGYKREMEKIVAADAQTPTPIATLCINVLTAIAERPGRIYDGKQPDINLMTEVRAALEKGVELSKKKVATS